MRKHFVLLACLFSFLGLVGGSNAAVPTMKDRVARVSEITPAAHPSESKFFDTLAPRPSFRGAVRTFMIQVGPIAKAKPQVREEQPKSNSKQELVFGNLDPSIKPHTGAWMVPCSGEISSLFGYRKSPVGRGMRFHAGIDVRAPRGTPIRSAGSGRVIFSGWRRGYGLTVVVDHGAGMQTVYAHCTKLLVFVGSPVRPGSLIGTVGTTGSTTGNHLHFEFRKNNRLVNPQFIFRR